MGCGQSKIESEEAVARCKERKEFMKKAVSSRNAFAAAHSLYTISLKNTGASLSDYGQGEADLILPSSSSSASIPSSSVPVASTVRPIDNPLPPPPPLPDCQPSTLQRAASMPEIPIPKNTRIPPRDDAINEDEEDGDADDEEEDDGDEDEHRRRQNTKDGEDVRPVPSPPAAAPPRAQQQQQQVLAKASGAAKASLTPVWLSQYFFDTENIPVPSLSQPEVPPPLPLPQEEKEVVTGPTWSAPTPPPPVAVKEQEQVKKKKKAAQHQHTASDDGGEGKRGRVAAQSVNLVQVLDELDEHFLKVMESAHEVSKMLEATRMHYHSNFADNRGNLQESGDK